MSSPFLPHNCASTHEQTPVLHSIQPCDIPSARKAVEWKGSTDLNQGECGKRRMKTVAYAMLDANTRGLKPIKPNINFTGLWTLICLTEQSPLSTAQPQTCGDRENTCSLIWVSEGHSDITSKPCLITRLLFCIWPLNKPRSRLLQFGAKKLQDNKQKGQGSHFKVCGHSTEAHFQMSSLETRRGWPGKAKHPSYICSTHSSASVPESLWMADLSMCCTVMFPHCCTCQRSLLLGDLFLISLKAQNERECALVWLHSNEWRCSTCFYIPTTLSWLKISFWCKKC